MGIASPLRAAVTRLFSRSLPNSRVTACALYRLHTTVKHLAPIPAPRVISSHESWPSLVVCQAVNEQKPGEIAAEQVVRSLASDPPRLCVR